MIVGITSGKFLQPIGGLNLSFRPTKLVGDIDFAKAWMDGWMATTIRTPGQREINLICENNK